jgi:hypothetical protein
MESAMIECDIIEAYATDKELASAMPQLFGYIDKRMRAPLEELLDTWTKYYVYIRK